MNRREQRDSGQTHPGAVRQGLQEPGRPHSPRAAHRFAVLRVTASVLLAAGVLHAAAMAQNAPAAAREALAALGAEEARTGGGRLTLAITEHRGEFKKGETPEAMQKRVTEERPLSAGGSFLFGPQGWRKELKVAGPAQGGSGARTLTGEQAGVLRILVETTAEGRPVRLGRVNRVDATSPGDAVLGRRVAGAVKGIEWTAARAEGEQLTLEGKRGTERHTLVVGRAPRPHVKSWQLIRQLTGPGGEKLEQTYSCAVTLGEAPGSVQRIEEWVVNPPPPANIAHRVTEVRKMEPLAALKPEELAVRFPAGTRVTDARGDVPVDYVQTVQGVSEEAVSETARKLTEGRVKPGQTAPDIELRDLKGAPVHLNEYHGRTVVLFWFSSQSGPSGAAAKAIKELSEEYKTYRVQFLGLNVGEDTMAAKRADEFRSRYKWSFPVLLDEGEGLRRYGAVAGVPKVAVIDRNGILTYVQPGVDPDAIAAALDKLVGAG